MNQAQARRRRFALALGAAALTAPFVSFAQPQARVRRIGFLALGSAVS